MGFDEVGQKNKTTDNADNHNSFLKYIDCGRSFSVGGVSSQVFMINLERRPDRRKRMLRSLYEQEVDCKVFPAVDGK